MFLNTRGVEVSHKERVSRIPSNKTSFCVLPGVSQATGNDRFYLTELSPSTSSLAFPAGFFLGFNVTGRGFSAGLMDMMIFDGGRAPTDKHKNLYIFAQF